MKKLAALLVFTAMMAVTSPLQAAAVRCEGCSPAEFYQKAIQLGPGKHVITSLSTGEMKGYEVLVEMEPGANYGTYYVVEYALPSEYWESFDDARDFYIATAGSMKSTLVVDANDLNDVQGLYGATVYDIMSDYNLRGRLGDRLYNEPLPYGEVRDEDGNIVFESSALARGLEGLRQLIYAKLGVSDGSVEIVVVTELGGFVVYRISMDMGTGEYLEGRSRNPDGQVVPEDNAREYTGTYLGETSNLLLLSQFMQDHLGASMSSEGQGSIMVSLECSWRSSASGGTLACTRRFRRFSTDPT